MGMIGTILLWLLAAAFTLLLAVLLSPLRVELRLIVGEGFRYNVALRLIGRFGPRVLIVNSDKSVKKRVSNPKKEKNEKSSGKTKRHDPRRFSRAVFRLISEIISQIHIDRADIDFRFGASDPADTGEIFGYLTPLIYGVFGSRLLRINVEPVFDKAVFDGCAALDVTMTPARFIPPFVRFGWSTLRPRR